MRHQLLDDLAVLLAGELEQLLRLATTEQLVRVAADDLGQVRGDDRAAGSTTVQPAASARGAIGGDDPLGRQPERGLAHALAGERGGGGRRWVDGQKAPGAQTSPSATLTPEMSTR